MATRQNKNSVRASHQRYTIHEIESCTGRVATSYLFNVDNDNTTNQVQGREGSKTTTARIDILPNLSEGITSNQDTLLTSVRGIRIFNLHQTARSIHIYLATLFLPTGYPHTVSPDYTPYQIYDSLQAFASSIAGLLSSRAVLQSLNITGTGPDTSTATYATLLSIAQSTISNLTTILFASHAAPYIASEVKFYRYLADIVNDAAFVLDCLSPSIPSSYAVRVPLVSSLLRDGMSIVLPLRVMTLCLSSAFRAICGVSGGSSKAVLSAHFARAGNIGELNAKDGSQETVIGLLGMWVGGFVVSRVEGRAATWCWMLGLLALHLWWNWCAVRSVRLTALNGRRAGTVLAKLVDEITAGKRNTKSLARAVSVDAVGDHEAVIFSRRSSELLVHHEGQNRKLRCKMGVSFGELVKAMGATSEPATGTLVSSGSSRVANTLQNMIKLFKNEQYMIWCDMDKGCILIALKKNALPDDQLKTWAHAVLLARCTQHPMQDTTKNDTFHSIDETLGWLRDEWKTIRDVLHEAGWELGQTELEGPQSKRIDIED